jgi:hypothetical protein
MRLGWFIILPSLVVAATAARTSHANEAAAEPSAGPTEPDVRPTWIWALVQLVPSPELAIFRGSAHFGVRWQVTPLLYSTGIHEGLSPWRSLVAEPSVRHGGSLELYLAPEFVAAGLGFSRDWFFRPGVRSYFPLLHKGERLSCSIGAAAVIHGGDLGAAMEGGFYTFAGAIGVQAAYVPAPAFRMTTVTLNIRYF